MHQSCSTDVSSLDLSPKLQHYMCSHLLDIFTSKSSRYLRLTMHQTELLIFPSESAPPIVLPISMNHNFSFYQHLESFLTSLIFFILTLHSQILFAISSKYNQKPITSPYLACCYLVEPSAPLTWITEPRGENLTGLCASTLIPYCLSSM